MINYGRQNISKSDIQSVIKVLKSDLITQGDNVVKFENKLSKTFGSKYCGGIKWNSSITFVGISSGLEKKILY